MASVFSSEGKQNFFFSLCDGRNTWPNPRGYGRENRTAEHFRRRHSMGTTEMIQTVINYLCYPKIQVHVHLGMRWVSNCKLSHLTSLFYPFTLPVMQASLWLSIYTSLFSTDKTNQICGWVSQSSPFHSDKFSRQPQYGKDCGAFILCAVTYVRQTKYILKENNLQLIFTQGTN